MTNRIKTVQQFSDITIENVHAILTFENAQSIIKAIELKNEMSEKRYTILESKVKKATSKNLKYKMMIVTLLEMLEEEDKLMKDILNKINIKPIE